MPHFDAAQKLSKESREEQLLEALKDAYPHVGDNFLREKIGKLIVESEK